MSLRRRITVSNMVAECQVCEVSENSNLEEKGLFVINSNQTVVEEVNGEGEEGSDEEQNVNVDWMNEYPPLVSRGIQVCSAKSMADQGLSATSWVDALKKPYCPLDAKVNGEKFNTSTEESVASSGDSSRVNVNGQKLDIFVDPQEESSEVCSNGELVVEKENRLSTKACGFFSVKIPRFDDEVLKEQIRLAELLLDEKTNSRDAIRVQMETRIRENDYEHAVDQVRSARELLKLKRKEIDFHLSMIRTVRNAPSFEDMDSQEAFEQQLLAEEQLKTLKKELETLKARVLKAESAAAFAQKQNSEQEREVREVEARFRVANDACLAAYAQLKSLRVQHQEKMRQFYSYLDDEADVGKNNAHDFCQNNVEKFMKVWNKNNKFRQDYVKSNTKSTVRRFGTLDGRAVGPGEKPVMLPRQAVPVVRKENREKSVEKDDGLAMKAKEMRRQEVEGEADVGIEVTRKAEEKEQKVEDRAEKREKKRLKRLRLKERKKAAAVARDGFSLSDQRVQQENDDDDDDDDKMLKNKKIIETQVTNAADDEMLKNKKAIETVLVTNTADDANTKESKQEHMLEGTSDVQQQLTQKKRKKKVSRKERKEAKAARDNKVMKWIFWVVLITLTLLPWIFNFFTRFHIF